MCDKHRAFTRIQEQYSGRDRVRDIYYFYFFFWLRHFAMFHCYRANITRFQVDVVSHQTGSTKMLLLNQCVISSKGLPPPFVIQRFKIFDIGDWLYDWNVVFTDHDDPLTSHRQKTIWGVEELNKYDWSEGLKLSHVNKKDSVLLAAVCNHHHFKTGSESRIVLNRTMMVQPIDRHVPRQRDSFHPLPSFGRHNAQVNGNLLLLICICGVRWLLLLQTRQDLGLLFTPIE